MEELTNFALRFYRILAKKAALRGLSGRHFDVVVDFCAYSRGDIAGLAKILGDTIKQYIFISTVDVLKKGDRKDSGRKCHDKGKIRV